MQRTLRARPHTSETSPPPCRCSRPATSSSSSTIRTIRGRLAGEPHQIVDADRRRSKQGDDAVALLCARLGCESGGEGGLGSWHRSIERLAQDGPQHCDDVLRFGDQRGALLQQAVATLGARIERRAWDREDLAALFEREPGGDERARAARRLDHHDPDREARDQAVRRGKSRARGSQSSGISRAPHLAPGSRRQAPHARADRCNCARRQRRHGAGFEARPMGGGIDAAREARHDHKTDSPNSRARRPASFMPAADALRRPPPRSSAGRGRPDGRATR